jgi:hypothetical protein
MADEIKDAIVSTATGPAEVEVDGQRVRAHRPRDLIEADKYVKATEAQQSSNPLGGVKFARLVPPGAV